MTTLISNGVRKIRGVFPFGKIFLLSICFSFLFTMCKEDIPDGGVKVSEGDRSNAIEINKKLGRGMNMGNTFEAPSEDAWGNPWKPEYFSIMAELGFTHVRIPIRWEPEDRSMAEAPYTIFSEFLDRIKIVVDEAVKNNLYVIINMHHHEQLNNDPTGQHDRFLAQWEQISTYFQSYSDKLLFEIFNEPTAKFTAPMWNLYMSQAFAIIRKTNPERIVLIGTAEGGGIGVLKNLVLPNDKNIILTIHYYEPFKFTHQGANWSDGDMSQYLGTKWYDSEKERDDIRQDLEVLKTYSAKYANIPIHIGEFGSVGEADLDSRVRWTTFVTRWFEEQGFSWAFWEFSSGFGIYDPVNKTFLEPLVDALLHNPMPEPGVMPDPDPDPDPDPEIEPGILVYASNFTMTNDNWTLNVNNDAPDASLSRDNNSLTVDIKKGGGDGWHLQLAREGIPLKKGLKYRCTLSASAVTDCDFQFYLDDNGPNYQGINPETFYVTNTKKDFYSTFTYTGEDDNDTRIVLNLGKLPVNKFTLHSFKLEIIESEEPPVEPGISIYTSNFTTTNDNWTLNINNDAPDASLSRDNNSLIVDIKKGGGDGWHLQLARENIPLKKSAKYRCTLSIAAATNCDVQFYLDDNGPNYQAFNPETFSVTNTKTEFYSNFTYSGDDDNNTRIVFNIGKLPATKFTLYSFKLEEIQ